MPNVHKAYKDLANATSYILEDYINCFEQDMEGLVLSGKIKERYAQIVILFVQLLGFIASGYMVEHDENRNQNPGDLKAFWQSLSIMQSDAVDVQIKDKVFEVMSYFNSVYYYGDEYYEIPSIKVLQGYLCLIVTYGNLIIKMDSKAGSEWCD